MTKQSTLVKEQSVQHEEALQPLDRTDFDALMNRGINSAGLPVRQFNFVSAKLLTRPLTAMKHKRECSIMAESELYERELPVAGRSDKPVGTVLLDFQDLESGAHEVMVCSSVMTSTFRECAAVRPLTGRFFLLRAGDIVADKRYRHVDIAELFEKGGEAK